MSDLFSITHLILLSPFLLSLALDWIIGTAVASLPIAEKIRQCRLALSASPRRSPDRPALETAR